MNIRKAALVPDQVNRVILTAILPVLLALLGGCSSQREMGKSIEVPSGHYEAGSAINSEYFVRRGASLHLAYAKNCRIYVEAGGRFRGLEQGARNCTVYAEKGAKAERRSGVHYRRVSDAREIWARRRDPVIIERDHGTVLGALVAGASLGRDDDDDDDRYRSKRRKRSSSQSGEPRISKSSYEKKNQE